MRLYICHTFYHVYISVLKEMVFQKENGDRADILLSTLSTEFGNLEHRLRASDLFGNVELLLECHPRFFKEPFKGELGQGNPLKKLIQRHRYFRYIVKNEEPYLSRDYGKYKDIYVFCDSDPIGYYLNGKKIPYISVEDGNNSGRYNSVVTANKSMFTAKRWLSKANYLYMQDGYSKYSRAYEVNCAEGVIATGRRIIERPTAALIDQLTHADKERLYHIFRSWEELPGGQEDAAYAMILTQPLCTEENRIAMYREIVSMYADQYKIIIKPHPIDRVDYEKEFPDCLVMPGNFPVEILNIHNAYNIAKAVTVYSTSMEHLSFAKEKESLGVAFLDKYEDPSLHADLKRYEVDKK